MEESIWDLILHVSFSIQISKKTIVMKKVCFSLALLVLGFVNTSLAQIHTFRNGSVVFFSDAPMEDIKATNDAAQGVMSLEKNEFSFRVPIKSFVFESELMGEHFNENYMESEKYPYGTFKGSIAEKVDLSKDGSYEVTATGTLTVHGVEIPRTIPVSLKVENSKIAVSSKFVIKLKDHNIEIPTLVFQKIAEEVEVTVVWL